MPRRRIHRAVAALAVALLLAPTSAPATQAMACASQHTPARIWSGEALSQTFTPTSDTVSRLEAKVFFRRAFSGTIRAWLHAAVPVEVGGEIGVRGIEVAALSAPASGAAGTSTWVTFRLSEPLRLPARGGGPILELELRPGRDGSWAWIQCASSYAGGRAYVRAPIRAADTAVPNDGIKFGLTGTADLTFRAQA